MQNDTITLPKAFEICEGVCKIVALVDLVSGKWEEVCILPEENHQWNIYM